MNKATQCPQVLYVVDGFVAWKRLITCLLKTRLNAESFYLLYKMDMTIYNSNWSYPLKRVKQCRNKMT